MAISNNSNTATSSEDISPTNAQIQLGQTIHSPLLIVLQPLHITYPAFSFNALPPFDFSQYINSQSLVSSVNEEHQKWLQNIQDAASLPENIECDSSSILTLNNTHYNVNPAHDAPEVCCIGKFYEDGDVTPADYN